MNKSTPEFARAHIAELVFVRVELEGAIAIFYRIAGQWLLEYRPLSSHERQSQLRIIFAQTNQILLEEWNENAAFEQAVHPQTVLQRWLSFRLDSGGNIERFLQDSCHVDPDTAGLLINGHVFPNPLLYARRPEIWGKARSIDIATGFIHGDLNTNNILVKFSDDKQTLEGYYLIDFALFKDQMPLLYDHAPMLELRAAIGLSRLCQEQGDNERARKVLSEAYSKITEGFATHDLKEATTLLADSSEPLLNSRGDRD